MSIRRYVANKDTTITNAYKENLITRATTANMGASDVLEVFSVYGQATTSSLEASRILIEFPISDILSDRNNKKIGSSGSVDFILKLSNAVHTYSTPSNFTLLVSPLSKSWDEGVGLDMETYLDLDSANWLSSSNATPWTNQGGDFLSQSYEQYFDIGTEDLELNITNLVEQWIQTSVENNGVIIKLTGSQENSNESYYTKKFFARGSEFFYKRPWIEARTTDHLKDSRANFIVSSSLLDSQDNLNTLFLYNRFRGTLKNIPSIGTGSNIYVSLYQGTTKPNLPPLILHNGDTKVQGGFYKTGIYTASLAINTTSSMLFDVWFSGSSAESPSSVVFSTGSIIVSEYLSQQADESEEYVANIINLKNKYSIKEVANFRTFIRDRNWNPNIYTVASVYSEGITLDQLYYKITRIEDNLDVIAYGTGSKQHTRTSYDQDGNYFNLDLSILESDYAYYIKFGYIHGDEFRELKETFKFRVE